MAQALSNQGIEQIAQSFPERIRMLEQANDRLISLCYQHAAPQFRGATHGRSQAHTVGTAGQRPKGPISMDIAL
jgi:hypothetical protein